MTSTSIATTSRTSPTKKHGNLRGKEVDMNLIPPLSVSDLLGAGTFAFHLREHSSIIPIDTTEDGWTELREFGRIRACVTEDSDVRLLDSLSFLQLNTFIRATYTLRPNDTICIRVYLVPYDISGSKGVLKNRDETKIMVPARKALREILMRVSKDQPSWMGTQGDAVIPFFDGMEDERSLAQIFNGLTTTTGELDLDAVSHLRTDLYDYQRNSVATMLHREKHNRVMNDPLYIAMTAMGGEVYYLQPATLEVLLECPQYSQSKGGFLCEELGTGKTIMILALILASRNVLPKPPEGMTDDYFMLTPLSLRHFPYSQQISARNLAMRGNPRVDLRLPSLLEICCDYIRTSPDEVNVEQYEDELEIRGLWEPIMRNTPFYLHLDRDFMREFHGRRQRIIPPRIMYLSHATLIVVPRALVAQWKSEISKHCTTSVRHFVIKRSTKIPPAHKLATDYDIIIVSDSRISAETLISDESSLHIGYTCHCRPFARIRVPDCNCSPPKSASPLLQVRWKRLVRDEGHNAVTLSTNLNHFLKLISAERRWIVTGTPTTNLLGLNLGRNSDTRVAEEGDTSTSQRNTPAPVENESISGEVLDSLSKSKRIWRSSDREDIRKLGSMMEHFLCVPRFAGDPRAFETLVAAPLFGRDGPLPGAVQVLTQVMAAHMIRHRIDDIEKDVVLPPMKEETVLLDLDPFAQMTYNVLLAAIVINAVDSERKDQDYLFHPYRSYQLAATIENLSHALFWRIDEYSCDWELADTIIRAQDAIVHATERNQSEEDLRLVDQAIMHLRKAYDDPLYRAMQHGLEVPYRMHRMPESIIRAWGAFSTISLDFSNHPMASFMYPKFLLELRRTVERRPLISQPRLCEMAELVRDAEQKLTALAEARAASLKSGKEDRRGKNKVKEEQEVGKVKLKQMHRAVDTKAKLEERQREYLAAQERLLAMAKIETPGEDVGEISAASSSTGIPDSTEDTSGGGKPRSSLLKVSALANAGIGNSTSSKLNYILEEVLNYSATEKFLIFSNQPFNLVHIAEGLELLGIKFLQFTAESGADRRDQDLTTFETSETYRVFLMELRYGARGLNIVSASRVIFCEPVWHADVESQAIKRVHRIGQTRPVTVKTLAIRNTFEEHMIERRKMLKGVNAKTPGMMEEGGIRSYLQNPSFLEGDPQINVNLDYPLLLLPKDADVSTERDTVLVSEDVGMQSPAEQSRPLADGNNGIKRKIKITFKAYTGDGAHDRSTDRAVSGDFPANSIVITPPRQRRKVVHFA